MAKNTNKHTTVECTLDMDIGALVIRMPLQLPPSPSASGKTLVLASTRGNLKTTAVWEGKPIVLGVNAYVPK